MLWLGCRLDFLTWFWMVTSLRSEIRPEHRGSWIGGPRVSILWNKLASGHHRLKVWLIAGYPLRRWSLCGCSRDHHQQRAADEIGLMRCRFFIYFCCRVGMNPGPFQSCGAWCNIFFIDPMIGLFFLLWSPFFNLHRFWPVPFFKLAQRGRCLFPKMWRRGRRHKHTCLSWRPTGRGQHGTIRMMPCRVLKSGVKS